MSNSKKCPSCGANNWKYAEVVYKQGLTHVQSTGDLHQTYLSKQSAPPQQGAQNDASTGFALIVYFIGLPIVYFSSPEITFWGAVFTGKLWLAALGASVIAMLLGLDKETDESKKQAKLKHEKWKNKKVCMRCSHTFE